MDEIRRLRSDNELQFLRELHFIEAHHQSVDRFDVLRLQFLRELHFIEAGSTTEWYRTPTLLQFLRELHFIKATRSTAPRSSAGVAVPSGAALH